MQYLYIDESGSMTNQYTKSWPYFVIAIIRTEEPDKLRKLHKRFIGKYLVKLKAADSEGRMFKGGVFQELKGTAFTPDLKRAFATYLGRENTMDLYYIVIDNKRITNELYSNTARAFNYVLKLALEYFIRKGDLPNDEYTIQLDERNERTDTRHFLQNYLNTELRMENILSKDIQVQYFDSSQNKIIQIADVLANLYYSQLRTNNYEVEFEKIEKSGCLKSIFIFPPH